MQCTEGGVAGALGSAAAMNHANNIAHDAGLTADDPLPLNVTNCTDVAGLLDGGQLPQGYTINSLAIGAAEGESVDCTLNGLGSTTPVTFRGYNVVHP